MKKALLAGLIFILAGFMLVSGTFALPTWDEVFQIVTGLVNDKGVPERGEELTVTLQASGSSQNLYPGGEASRTHTVKNVGEADAYFRLVYVVQYDADTWTKLSNGITFTKGDKYIQDTAWRDVTIDGIPYKMMVFTYNTVLNSGESAQSVTMTVAMDKSFTNDELARYRSDFLQTQVLAIDPEPFVISENGVERTLSAVEALDRALPIDKINPDKVSSQ